MDPRPHTIPPMRTRILNESLPLDTDLIRICKGVESHAFLANPSGQLAYLYLTKLVKEVSSAWFGKDFKSLRCLDWGCGKGHVTHLLRKAGGDVISCDVQASEGDDDSSFSQETPILDANRIDVVPLTHEFELPFPDESFDLVVSFGVLEHVPKDSESLGEIQRVLKPNGLFFCFFLPYSLSWTQRLQHLRGNYYHDRLYSKRHTASLLRRAGFRLLDLWHRAILPKNTVRYPAYYFMEKLDHLVSQQTPLKYLATNLEFIACKEKAH